MRYYPFKAFHNLQTRTSAVTSQLPWSRLQPRSCCRTWTWSALDASSWRWSSPRSSRLVWTECRRSPSLRRSHADSTCEWLWSAGGWQKPRVGVTSSRYLCKFPWVIQTLTYLGNMWPVSFTSLHGMRCFTSGLFIHVWMLTISFLSSSDIDELSISSRRGDNGQM